MATEDGGLLPLKLAIFRKSTHSDMYLKFKSSHPVPMMRTIVHGMSLRAQRILQNHPIELAHEIHYLKRVFSNSTNGYPIDLILCWFGQFRREIRLKPQILQVKTRLNFEDFFVFNSQKIFDFPTAEARYTLEHEMDLMVISVDSQLNADQGLNGLEAAPPIDLLASAQDLEASSTGNLVCQDGTIYDTTGGRLPSNEGAEGQASSLPDQPVPGSLVPVVPDSQVPGARIISGTDPVSQVQEGTAVPAGATASLQATSIPRQ